MGKPKLSEVKSVVSKIEKMRRRNANLLMPTRLGASAEETQEYLKLLTPLFTRAGLDFDKFNKIQDRTSPLAAKPDPELTKEYFWRKKSLQKNAESISAMQPLLLDTANHQLLNIQPLFIFANPASALQSSNIGLNDNWAKFYWDYKLDSMVPDSVEAFLSFFYVWENSSESPALVDVDTYVGLYGKCTAHADGGFSQTTVGARRALRQQCRRTYRGKSLRYRRSSGATRSMFWIYRLCVIGHFPAILSLNKSSIFPIPQLMECLSRRASQSCLKSAPRTEVPNLTVK
jgi:hypothetical protein